MSQKETFHKIQNGKHFLSNRKKRRALKTSRQKMIFSLLNSRTDKYPKWIPMTEKFWHRPVLVSCHRCFRTTVAAGKSWFCLSNGNRNRKSPVHHLDFVCYMCSGCAHCAPANYGILLQMPTRFHSAGEWTQDPQGKSGPETTLMKSASDCLDRQSHQWSF